MAFSFKPALRKLGLAPFKLRWVLIAACAFGAWSLLHGEREAPTAPHPDGPGIAKQAAAGRVAPGSGPAGPGPGAAPAMAPAQKKPVESALFGLSTSNVIVNHNDTLDRIFRRLKLSLSDLAS